MNLQVHKNHMLSRKVLNHHISFGCWSVYSYLIQTCVSRGGLSTCNCNEEQVFPRQSEFVTHPSQITCSLNQSPGVMEHEIVKPSAT